MSVATARPGELFIAVGAAVALHAVLFALLVLLALAEILIDSKRERVEPQPLESEAAVIELSADYFEVVAPAVAEPAPLVPVEPVAPPVALQQKQFMDTSDEQASETPPDAAAFIGERDTRAAAELPPDPDGPPLPSQEGEEPRHRELELFNSDFNPGTEPGDRSSTEANPERLAGTIEEGNEGEGPPSEPEEMTVTEAGRPAEALLESDEAVPVASDVGERPSEAEETLPRERENDSAAEEAKQGEEGVAEKQPEEQPKERGFRTEADKTSIRGSINRRGKSALDVDNTVVGRYRAKVYRAIETEWQLQCLNYRNHILPGTLALRFYVDKNRQVLNPRYTYEFETSGIQRGFTLNAVRQADLPPMPKEVIEELGGKPMECEIGFNF